ncbi:MAG: FxsA family protein [Planctomycetaceae bacterium]|jgi:UPF0716 protein FxsA|nr:FxsA family protein [Planctomycetaceae bacterium]
MQYWKLILLFVFIPVIELAGLCFFVFLFSFWFVLIFIICVSFVGVMLAKLQGTRCWIEFNRQLDNRETPKLPVMHGMLILIAAALLIVPGLFSDLLGILLLLPFVRTIIIDHLTMRFENYRNKVKAKDNSNNYDNSADRVIDIS